MRDNLHIIYVQHGFIFGFIKKQNVLGAIFEATFFEMRVQLRDAPISIRRVEKALYQRAKCGDINVHTCTFRPRMTHLPDFP
ncbi:hypothetical protein I7I48_07427 [Histoplasma ohiense]|nr:hypothetical protein I7I48_07427 [Histoplasma ohiense (nom. inval.)]